MKKVKGKNITGNQKVRPEVAKLIEKISKKYAGAWKDLAKL